MTLTSDVDTRERLDGLLADVFVRRGYSGASLNELAQACELSKASLYHYYPGGKEAMAAHLLRRSVASLQRCAFDVLLKDSKHSLTATDKLYQWAEGFAEYAEASNQQCLIAVLGQYQANPWSEQITAQMAQWQQLLARTLEELNPELKTKRHRRYAEHLFATLYGALVMGQLSADDKALARAVKRCKANIDAYPNLR